MTLYSVNQYRESEIGSDDGRICWFCYSSEHEELPQIWINPCRCCGSTKWVHESCLQQWIDDQQCSDPNLAVVCRLCGYNYVIEYPSIDMLTIALNYVEFVWHVGSIYVLGGTILGCFYWSAVTYGALTVMQICGHDAALAAMGETDPFILFLGLPAIPALLVAMNLIKWQDRLLRIWRNVYRLPIFQSLRPKWVSLSRIDETRDQTQLELMSIPRILCSALTLPTFSMLCGQIFFRSIQWKLGRTLAGGILFLGFTGFLSIWHREKKFLRKWRRRIIQYSPE